MQHDVHVRCARTSLAPSQANIYNDKNEVTYVQWTIVDKEHKNDPNGRTSTIKKEFQTTQEQLLEQLTTQEQLLEQLNLMLRKFKRHTYNIKNQFTHYRALKQGLKAHECLINLDFSRK